MDVSRLSAAFQAVYGNPAVFASFSDFIPISFARVLPFRADDAGVDHHQLLVAEEWLLAGASAEARLKVVEAFSQCGLLSSEEVANLWPVIDFFEADFFELMGEVYANARMFRCALRWVNFGKHPTSNIEQPTSNCFAEGEPRNAELQTEGRRVGKIGGGRGSPRQ
jgi:hypothetical protein